MDGNESRIDRGARTEDAHERDSRDRDPGFTDAHDTLFRSHFQHANRLADRAYEEVRPAYRLGHDAGANARFAGREFEEIETELRNGWLSIRTEGGEWASVREYARAAFERGRGLGFNFNPSYIGGTTSHQRQSFSDPIAGGIDPTSADSPG